MNEAHYYKVKGLIERDKNMWNPTDYLHLAGGLMDYIPRLKEEVEGFGEVFESGMRDISKKEDNRELFLECYDLIHEVLDKYLDIPYEKRVIIAIWIVGTYMHDGFETYPYLFLNAMRGSGKTRALKLITELANGKILLSLTEAALFRTTGTIGIDEFESIGSKDKQALRELLNAGYKKGSTIIRMKKKKTMEGEDIVSEEFNPYRPIVMANINGMEEVLGDRCITLILEKSNKPIYTKLIEDFSTNSKVAKVKTAFREALCTWCMNITKKKCT